jgi:uncharacterized membrane protein
MTGRVEIAGSIAGLEVITEIAWYYLHERGWAAILLGQASRQSRYSQNQPLIYHPEALPISAAFGLRYVHTLMRRWAASGMVGCWASQK